MLRFFNWLFIAFCLFCFTALCSVNMAVAKSSIIKVKLTPEETAYLQQNPSIRVHAEKAWYPFNFISNGQVSGYSNDLIRLVAEKVGVEIEFVAGYQREDYLQKLKDKEIDVISNMEITPSREEYAVFTRYHPLKVLDGLLTHSSKNTVTDFNSIKSLAITENAYYRELIHKKYPHIDFKITTNVAESIEQLRLGNVDAVIDTFDTINFYLQISPIQEVKNTPLYDQAIRFSSPQFMGVRKDKIILRNILDKGLLAITRAELRSLNTKWSLLNSSLISEYKNSFQDKRVIFSNRQRQYLEDHGPFRMCVNPNRSPIEMVVNGKYIGVAADFVKSFSKNINNDVVLVKTNSWAETLHFFEQGKCDFIPAINKTAARKNTLLFTFPYLRFPLGLVTHQNNFSQHLTAALKQRLGVVKGFSYIQKLQTLYPDINLKEYKSMDAAFEAMKGNEIYGVIDSLPILSKKIQKDSPEFKVVNKVEDVYTLSLAVAKNDLILLDIFNKLLASIDLQEQEYILNRWLPVLYEKNSHSSNFDSLMTVEFFSVLIFLLLSSLYFSKRANKKLGLMKLKLEALATHDFLTELPHREYFKQQLKKEWLRGQRSNEKISLIIIDIDNFKHFNEQYGRAMGDECLIELSRRLQVIAKRPADLLARWQGDEFIMLLPETDERGMKAIAVEILHMLNEWSFTFIGAPTGNTLSVSLGAACLFPTSAYSEEEITRRASKALYQAQDQGYNQMVVYQSGN